MYQLATSIPYLLNRLGVRLGTLFSRRIEPFGLTLPMYRVLASLREQPGQKLGELADTTVVELSTMSRMVGTLVAAGLVTRERIPNNERTVSINLTNRGKVLADDLIREAIHYEEVAVSKMKTSDVEKLKSLLEEMYNLLDILESELVSPKS